MLQIPLGSRIGLSGEDKKLLSFFTDEDSFEVLFFVDPFKSYNLVGGPI